MLKKSLVAALALSIGAVYVLPADAQMRTSRPGDEPTVRGADVIPGPTRVFAIPRANLQPAGEHIWSTNLIVGAGVGVGAPLVPPVASLTPGLGVGFGTGGTALSLSTQMAISDNFQLDAGISGVSAGGLNTIGVAPALGRIDVAGKWGFNQGIFPVAIAGIAGTSVNIDPNGNPSLGFTLGVPLTLNLAMGGPQLLLTAYPNLSSTFAAPGTIGAGILPGMRPGVGLAASLGLTDRLWIMADSSLNLNTGAVEGTNAGVRYAFTNNMSGDLWASMVPNPAPGVNPNATSVGAGLNWNF